MASASLLRALQQTTKLAFLGGPGNDNSFEDSFANLAQAYLADKAPKLQDYQVGFQLLDRADDGNRAAALMGFKVGNIWLYAPVFFIDGNLKGHELLFNKNENMFLPLKENWVNMLLNRRPQMMGEGVSRNLRQLGVIAPEYSRIARSPAKYASWAKAAMPDLARALIGDPLQSLELNLPKFLGEVGVEAAATLHKWASEYPGLARALNQFCPPAELDAAIKQAASVAPKQLQPATKMVPIKPVPPIKQGGVKVIRFDQASESLLPDEVELATREKVMRDGLAIQDDRGDDEVTYKVDAPQTLANPSESGIYDVLCKEGVFKKCLVLLGPHTPGGRAAFATLLALDDQGENKAWVNIHPSRIWVGAQHTPEAYQEWFDGLATTMPDAARTYTRLYMVLAPRPDGSVPFSLRQENGEHNYEADFRDYARHGHALTTPAHHHYGHAPTAEYGDEGSRILLERPEGSKLRSTRGNLYVPKNHKLILVKRDAQAEARDDARRTEYDGPCCGDTASEPAPIEPGTRVDLELKLWAKTSMLRVGADGTDYYINQQRFEPLPALLHLVRDQHLREGDAREMLKEAMAEYHLRRNHKSYRVRYPEPKTAAPSSDLIDGAPLSPYMPEPQYTTDGVMGSQMPTILPQEQEVPVQSLYAVPANREFYRPVLPSADPQVIQGLQQAAQTGQREIFDASTIGALLKTTRDDQLVDRYLGPLMKGMDALGRLLFQFYWHHDQFKDRFGDDDMSDLEDSLRNTFENLGDVVLFLREQQIEPNEYREDINLDDSAAQ